MNLKQTNLSADIQDQIITNAPFGVMVFQPVILDQLDDYIFKLVSSNRIANALIGLSENSEDKQYLSGIFPDPAATEIYRACTESLKSGQISLRSIVLKPKSTPIPVNIQIHHIEDRIVLYILEQNPPNDDAVLQIEEEIKYRELFETSLDAIFLAVGNFNITSVNPKFCEIFKYNDQGLSELILSELFKDNKAYQKFIDQLHNKKFVEEFETELLTSDGEVCFCVINAVPVLDDNNELIMYQGVVRDMTRRREAEQQLITAEKLTLTGKLARSIAHEVRNPLTNIRLALDQFKEEVPEGIEDADFFLDLISRNADRISNLITDLMNSSKQKTLELQQYQVNDLLKETINLIQDRLNLKEIAYETSFVDDLPYILLDKNQIKIAFLNIFLNAIEAMVPGKGLLKILTRKRGVYIYVEVMDNGKGIPEEEVGNLFEPFYTGRKDGSGLGLTTTRNIIHAHKGSIQVESEVGNGTNFKITFSSEINADQINTDDKI